MRCRIILIVMGMLLGSQLAGAAEAPGEDDVLATLRKAHPRLLVLDDDIARLRQQVKDDATAGRYFEHLKSVGDKLLDEPVSERILIGPRLLHVSRQVLGRIATLGGLYRLTGEEKYAIRCREEMLAAAAFADWNPSHFLDVAEMTNALGIGYDWIHPALSEADRATIRTAIVEKGLKPGLAVYAADKGWHKRTNNWNQVCNGGLTVGALAVADEEPEIARQIIRHARASIPLAMADFAPDGGCVEGPGYWSHATRYMIYYGAALRTALGSDFGFFDSPGFANTGMFRIHSIGPLGRTFNYADAGDGAGGAAQMFYLARAFDRPVYATHERMMMENRGDIDPFHLLWFNADGTKEEVEKLPTAEKFDGVEVALMRSAWGDPQAAFVGFKGGDNAASHANLDLGTFVYDVDGVRWALDLGPDDYNLPAYFGKLRWTYYRMRTEGQNTLTLDGQNQNVRGKSKIAGFSAVPERPFAVADLTDAYAGQAQRVTRRIELAEKRLTITDELTAAEPVEVVWHMHTRAMIQIQPEKNRAVLSQDNKRVIATIEEPPGARFEIAPSDPVPEATANPPSRSRPYERLKEKLLVRLPEKVKDLRLTVVLAPE